MSIELEGFRGDIIRGLEKKAKIESQLLHDSTTREDRARHVARKYAFIEIADALRRGWPNGS